jgi:hypothetical protein
MPPITTIALIAAIAIGTFIAFLLSDRWIHNRGEVVQTGLMGGVAVSTKYRWMLLINCWFTNVFGLVLFAFVISLTFIGIARHASDGFVESLAYLCAVAYSTVCVVWAILGPMWFLHYRQVLRETRRE